MYSGSILTKAFNYFLFFACKRVIMLSSRFPAKGQPKQNKRCLHGKEKYFCRECKGAGICFHGRKKSRCIDCGGSEMCTHGKRKSNCKHCGGGSICMHDRQKSDCRECQGTNFCQHNRRKAVCTDCCGGSICRHGKRKSRCKECGGSEICNHGRFKNQCKFCLGRSICCHHIQRSNCKICGGSSICEHGRKNSSCKECRGGSVCEHGNIRSVCKGCKGGSVCVHNRIRSSCKECKGGSICLHGQLKKRCEHCGYKCISCHFTIVVIKNSQCQYCLPVAKLRSRNKELCIAAELDNWAKSGILPAYTSWNKVNPDSNKAACGKYRPDFVWDLKHRIIILEVDEFQHKNDAYIPRCELVRVAKIVEGYGQIPVHIIRYNPDAFKIAGVTRRTTYGERVALLKSQLLEALSRPDFDHQIIIQHLWFDQDTATSDFATTQRYRTLEEYEAWVESVCPQ